VSLSKSKKSGCEAGHIGCYSEGNELIRETSVSRPFYLTGFEIDF
jgi:hypothetical protein